MIKAAPEKFKRILKIRAPLRTALPNRMIRSARTTATMLISKKRDIPT
jgi:hypothetical protein